jgi:hypothetical protein
MSKYIMVDSKEVCIKDEQTLLETLAEMGYDSSKVEVHEKPVALHGFQGDERVQKAHVVIRRRNVGHSSNDIGFEKQEDGSYKAWVSDYDKHRGLGQKIVQNEFFQAYAKNRVLKWAKQQRGSTAWQKEKQKIKIRITM